MYDFTPLFSVHLVFSSCGSVAVKLYLNRKVFDQIRENQASSFPTFLLRVLYACLKLRFSVNVVSYSRF